MTREEMARMDRFERKLDDAITLMHETRTEVKVHESAEQAHGIDSVKKTLQRAGAIGAVLIIVMNLVAPSIIRLFS